MKFRDEVNYASSPYGQAPAKAKGGLGLLRLILPALAVAGFAGGVVVLYGRSDRLGSDGAPPLLQADATPTRQRPQDPGGMEVPNQDKLVYDRLNAVNTKRPQVEHLLPPPEQPLPRPLVSPQTPAPPPPPQVPYLTPLPPGVASQPSPLNEGGPAAVLAAPGAAPLAPPVAGRPAVAKPGAASPSAAAPTQNQRPPIATSATPSPAGVLKPPESRTPATPAQTAASPPPVDPKAGDRKLAGGAGGWRVQLASVRTEDEAKAEWKRLFGRHPDALGALSLHIAKVEIADKGVFYRVQGAGADEARARSVCDKLKAQNVGCVIVQP